MSFTHGKNTAFKLDNSAGTIVDLSTYCDEVSFPRTIETGETTTFQVSGGAKTYLVGLSDSTISLSGKFHATLDAHMSGVVAAQAAGTQVTGTFEYGPAGGAGGAIRYTGECIVTSYEQSSPVGDVVTWSAELQVTGSVTRNTF
jgi:hypothetical protein